MKLTKEELVKEMLDTVRLTEAFNAQDLAWCQLILERKDGQSGSDQLKPFLTHALDFLEKKETLAKRERDTGVSQKLRLEYEKEQLHQSYFTTRSLYYKQRKILIAVAQRKKHPQHLVANLGGFIAPQVYRCEIETCFGLGYSESRNYLVKKAQELHCTHILFVDDDVLVPLEALDRLANANEPMVGANYLKRNSLNESVVTTIGEDKTFVYHNVIVDAKQGDYAPVAVNAMGMGCTLISLDVFKVLPDPPFSFVYETLANGNKGRLLVGEDSHLVQQMLMRGFTPKILPGLCCVHTSLSDGKMYGPEWLVQNNVIRPEFKDKYTHFVCDPKELYARDNSNEFSGA